MTYTFLSLLVMCVDHLFKLIGPLKKKVACVSYFLISFSEMYPTIDVRIYISTCFKIKHPQQTTHIHLFLVLHLVWVSTMEPNCDSIFTPAIPTEIHGIKILKQPSDAKLTELGVASWPMSVHVSIHSFEFKKKIYISRVCFWITSIGFPIIKFMSFVWKYHKINNQTYSEQWFHFLLTLFC